MVLYGIKNCNTVKSAVDWLNSNKVKFEFHITKAKVSQKEKLREWSDQVGWEVLVNKRGTTWRQLDESIQARITNENAAIALMMDKTSVIKRPLIEDNGKVVALGFDEAAYKKVFS